MLQFTYIRYLFSKLVAIHTALVLIFQCLNTICHRQVGGRKLLLDVVPIIWNDTSLLINSSNASRSPLLRKYLMKLTQRIGLTCLPHHTPSWRYVVRNAKFFTFFLNSKLQLS